MMRDAYNQGRANALSRFKLSNIAQSPMASNSTLNGPSTTNPVPQPATTITTPPVAPAAPTAAGAAKARPLG